MNPASLKVKHGHAELNGLRCHYVEAGEGPLVVLLHGFPESWWGWRYQIEPLAQAGFRVVVPDQRGYNETDKKTPYDLDTLSSDICALIRSLGYEKAHVVGHDVGGAVTWHLGATRNGWVDRLVVINSPHPAKTDDALRPSREHLMRSWHMFAFPLPVVPEMTLSQTGQSLLTALYEKSTKDGAHFSEAELQPFFDALKKPGTVKAMIGWYRASLHQAIRRRGDMAHYHPVDEEVLLLWSKSDAALSYDDWVPGLESLAPKLRVEVLEGCGHFPHAEQPQKVNELLLRFLSGGRKAMRAAEAEATPVGKTSFNVVLSSAGTNKIAVIREVRNIMGLSLKEARELVEAAPQTLKEGASLMEAARIRTQLRDAGAVIEIT